MSVEPAAEGVGAREVRCRFVQHRAEHRTVVVDEFGGDGDEGRCIVAERGEAGMQQRRHLARECHRRVSVGVLRGGLRIALVEAEGALGHVAGDR
ncbi:MAG: hypothetical protein MUF21_01590, partial [Gemmatimonadaceae bacterium]|nr:hypothetical protein [Gemmatimonadaceae bacterium]